MLDESISIVAAGVEDSDAVRDFLRLNYIQDSPLNKCLKISPCIEIEDWGVDLLKDGFSFKAVNPKGDLVGILLNRQTTRTKPFFPATPETSTNQGFKVLMKFFDYFEAGYNLFEKYPDCECVFEVGIMSVSSEYRGAGIAKALLESTVALVKTLGTKLCCCICSSRFSGIICGQAGFKAVHQVAYKDYLVNGKRPVRPEEPHTKAVLYLLELGTSK